MQRKLSWLDTSKPQKAQKPYHDFSDNLPEAPGGTSPAHDASFPWASKSVAVTPNAASTEAEKKESPSIWAPGASPSNHS